MPNHFWKHSHVKNVYKRRIYKIFFPFRQQNDARLLRRVFRFHSLHYTGKYVTDFREKNILKFAFSFERRNLKSPYIRYFVKQAKYILFAMTNCIWRALGKQKFANNIVLKSPENIKTSVLHLNGNLGLANTMSVLTPKNLITKLIFALKFCF